MIKQIRALFRKHPRTVLFRANQEIRLAVWQRLGLWPKLAAKVDAHWDSSRVNAWRENQRTLRKFATDETISQFRSHVTKISFSKRTIHLSAADIIAGNVPIFGETHVINWDDPSWHEDWHCFKQWKPKFYKDYNFYDTGGLPGEIKFPWELSRLSYLQVVAVSALLEDPLAKAAWIDKIVNGWLSKNPCAYSVNWYPMECSMRGINLVLVLRILASVPKIPDRLLTRILQVITLHGEFISRNVEMSDRGENHFAANICALALIGELLLGFWKDASKWIRFAHFHLKREIASQFLNDGVQFEKATGYHRLVSELFLAAMLTSRPKNSHRGSKETEILERAFIYIDDYTHPDGNPAILGDNDDSFVFNFSGPPGDLQNIQGFGKSMVQKIGSGIPLIEAALLTISNPTEDACAEICSRHYSAGGIAISRHKSNLLVVDVGEVGFNGLGGHGHNDLFSFELSLDGHRIVVDSGCQSYTGNRQSYDRFRSSWAHNALIVDDQEIAPLLGFFRISSRAVPQDVVMEIGPTVDRISAVHTGYLALPDPVLHRRSFEFAKIKGELCCSDEIECKQDHKIVRLIHFAPNLALEETSSRGISILSGNQIVALLRWEQDTKHELTTYENSPHFGSSLTGQRVSFTNRSSGRVQLRFWIKVAA